MCLRRLRFASYHRPLTHRVSDSGITVVTPGINSTVQALPVRSIGKGIPPSGPMDAIAFQAANAIAGNDLECEGLEIVVPPPAAVRSSSATITLNFHAGAVIAVTGADAEVTVNGKPVPMWGKVVVPESGKVAVSGRIIPQNESVEKFRGGLRVYLSVFGGFPAVPQYLGSKSTSMGLGGYQARYLSTHPLILDAFDSYQATVGTRSSARRFFISSVTGRRLERWNITSATSELHTVISISMDAPEPTRPSR